MRSASRHAISRPACRLAWQPSVWATSALLAMGLGAALAIAVSGVPDALRAPLAACALAWSGARAWREHRRPRRVFVVRPDGTMTLDTIEIPHCDVHWRGPLAFLRARDGRGRVHRLAFWPDSLDARSRRALRLALRDTAPLAADTVEMRG